MSGELSYPNLARCTIVTSNLGAATNESDVDDSADISQSSEYGPVSLNSDCLDALHISIPKIYDFSFEKSIIQKHESLLAKRVNTTECNGGEVETTVYATTPSLTDNLSNPQKETLNKMKMILGDDEGSQDNDRAYISILEDFAFDLEASISEYYKLDPNTSSEGFALS
uniref:Uncharacterized protein n=1 Tax=Proboscia inermis TaxID=420281 RepID=A0A7S0C418_9STRA|mmetsp:Transcript_25710/g.26109  ORF Transcript_25710/g.26109 Transcript_25710/m.26109 type:complete len:169 (+) Transcript_25710:24-530(+)